MPVWLIQLLIGAGLAVLGYMLAPKPKAPPPPELDDLKSPTASTGREIPKIYGTKTIKGLNIIYFGEKEIRNVKVKA